jgi:hypothetical protein
VPDAIKQTTTSTLCHATEKSEAITMCKEMPVIPVNKVVDKKRKIGKKRAEEEQKHKGVADPPPSKKEEMKIIALL